MGAILQRLKDLEERQKPSVEEMKKEVLQYALRPIADLDKHVVLEKIENLKNIARDKKDSKADYYAHVYTTLQERIFKPANQFKNYVLSLLGDKDYAKIIETVSKIDKSCDANVRLQTRFSRPTSASRYIDPPSFGQNSALPQAAPFAHGAPFLNHNGGRRFRFCSFCQKPGHSYFTCFRRRRNGPYHQGQNGKN